MAKPETATIYRMVLPEHTCPFGVRAKELLTQAGFEVTDKVLRSREEVDSLEKKMAVETTPQVFIGDKAIGGCDELEAWLAEH